MKGYKEKGKTPRVLVLLNVFQETRYPCKPDSRAVGVGGGA
jgi:hypothetical protein